MLVRSYSWLSFRAPSSVPQPATPCLPPNPCRRSRAWRPASRPCLSRAWSCCTSWRPRPRRVGAGRECRLVWGCQVDVGLFGTGGGHLLCKTAHPALTWAPACTHWYPLQASPPWTCCADTTACWPRCWTLLPVHRCQRAQLSAPRRCTSGRGCCRCGGGIMGDRG